MKLYDIIKDKDYPLIEWYVSAPSWYVKENHNPWMFFGICSYIGEELNSLDGDTYSLESEIDHYEYDEDNEILRVYKNAEWIGG